MTEIGNLQSGGSSETLPFEGTLSFRITWVTDIGPLGFTSIGYGCNRLLSTQVQNLMLQYELCRGGEV
jgi:hypothetical protein